jgi:molecular chaperone GrpE
MTPHPHDEAVDPAADDATGVYGEVPADEASGDTTLDAASEVEDDLDAVLAVTRRERDEYLGMVQRVQADFENYKKRMMRQQTELVERAAESLVAKVLPVLDALDLARAHMGAGEDVSAEGKALLQASALLNDTLAREGLEPIDEADVAFDPTTHDAVDHVAAVDGDDGTVSAVLRAGYRWKGRVIRPAMVQVRG